VTIEFRKTKCANCGTYDNSTLIYKSNITHKDLTSKVFSARRIPDRRRYSWVRCLNCGLMRSDPIASIDYSTLYETSTFDYGREIKGLKSTYLKILRKARGNMLSTDAILEVGGGNGFFLEALVDAGFQNVSGIEPSKQAIQSSRFDIKPKMILGMMESGKVEKEKFDAVAMFHVLDHLEFPEITIKECLETLKPGGTFVVAVHNAESISARILKSRSPIIDVEHTYLYSRKTGVKLLLNAGLTQIQCHSYSNRYSLAYLIQLLPIPKKLKQRILVSPLSALLALMRFTLPLGNIWMAGVKPVQNLNSEGKV
jgi:SAM-dependent methyltransferase